METWTEIRDLIDDALDYWDDLSTYYKDKRWEKNPTPTQNGETDSFLCSDQEDLLSIQLYINLFLPELAPRHRDPIEARKGNPEAKVIDRYYVEACRQITDKIWERRCKCLTLRDCSY